jgi:transglutaminase-like putative cysteine protease
VAISYVVQQEFRYDYPGPIRDLHHRLIVTPPLVHGDQRRISHRLAVAPELRVLWTEDPFGNAIATVDAALIERKIHLIYEALIERTIGPDPTIDAHWLDDPRLLRPTQLTEPSEALRKAAALIRAQASDPREIAERINAYVARHMRYVPDVTTVETTATQAYAQGTGVCQDYAHIMLALCRLCDVPARYVSGHLLGEGGTHAWVEVLLATATSRDTAVLGFDPTHDRRTNLEYVFVAAGRDYADVAPTSGRFVAPYIGEFTTSRFVDRLDENVA